MSVYVAIEASIEASFAAICLPLLDLTLSHKRCPFTMPFTWAIISDIRICRLALKELRSFCVNALFITNLLCRSDLFWAIVVRQTKLVLIALI